MTVADVLLTLPDLPVSHEKRAVLPIIRMCCPLGECLLVAGSDHIVSVNPIAGSSTWRTDCDSCGTCLSANHLNRAAAIARATAHAIKGWDA